MLGVLIPQTFQCTCFLHQIMFRVFDVCAGPSTGCCSHRLCVRHLAQGWALFWLMLGTIFDCSRSQPISIVELHAFTVCIANELRAITMNCIFHPVLEYTLKRA